MSASERNHFRFADAPQLLLPLDVREKREVSWLVVDQEAKKRRLWFGNKIVTRIVEDEDGQAVFHRIDSDDIAKVKDPDLKMALRLADAAKAMGWIDSGPYTKYAHSVAIEATGEGFDSKLVNATYSGHPGDFEATLHLFAPKHEDN